MNEIAGQMTNLIWMKRGDLGFNTGTLPNQPTNLQEVKLKVPVRELESYSRSDWSNRLAELYIAKEQKKLFHIIKEKAERKNNFLGTASFREVCPWMDDDPNNTVFTFFRSREYQGKDYLDDQVAILREADHRVQVREVAGLTNTELILTNARRVPVWFAKPKFLPGDPILVYSGVHVPESSYPTDPTQPSRLQKYICLFISLNL